MPIGTGHFDVTAPFGPMGDQPTAIEQLEKGLRLNKPAVCLLGATGTGKTFTMANVISRLNKPTLIVSHNKTLAAQLYEELREFFPRNSVNYFVSYYDYYQPEAYIPQRDIYIEKDSSRNDDLDQLRLAATSNILSRRDTVVVASVSCIFGLGSPEAYSQKLLTITRGMRIQRREFLLSLASMQYNRSEMEWKRGQFRVRGDTIDIWPASEKFAVHVELFGDDIERLELINPASGEVLAEESQYFLFPAVHYVMPEERLQGALAAIRAELDARVMELRHEGKLLEAQRLISRTKFDLEMLGETGSCPGIENYSRFMDGRQPGERPFTLMDYFDYAPPERPSNHHRRNYRDWLLIIDESHVTLPQVRAMFNGDRARKEVLVAHGFRLPSAMDNRPLRFEEFEAIVPQMMFVSATPGPYELSKTQGEIAEQIIRPTGLLDPEVEIKPTKGQVPDLLERCKERAAAGERVLVTALTKRLCEDLSRYLQEKGVRVRYLHSDIETLDRVEILNDLRTGQFDVLVGVNLLREGLDLPEVSLVAILDADKEGFLRSPTSLIQLMGRAARNVNGRVIMYADEMTPAMRNAIDETDRRRVKQRAYNAAHNITPATIIKAVRRGLEESLKARKTAREAVQSSEPEYELDELIRILEGEMMEHAQAMEFEKAAKARDQANRLKRQREEAKRSGGPTTVKRSDVDAGKGRVGSSKAGMPGTSAGKRGKKKSSKKREF